MGREVPRGGEGCLACGTRRRKVVDLHNDKEVKVNLGARPSRSTDTHQTRCAAPLVHSAAQRIACWRVLRW